MWSDSRFTFDFTLSLALDVLLTANRFDDRLVVCAPETVYDFNMKAGKKFKKSQFCNQRHNRANLLIFDTCPHIKQNI